MRFLSRLTFLTDSDSILSCMLSAEVVVNEKMQINWNIRLMS